MGEYTKIEWTHHTFNPWWGCVKVSPGCKYCYADAHDARRLRGDARHWGARAPRRFATDAHMAKPIRWNKQAEKAGERHRVFCMSMGDVFELHVDPDVSARQSLYRARVFHLIDQTPSLDWLLLSKRPENVEGMVPWLERFPANVWLGVSVENQEMAEERIPTLLDLDERYQGVRPFLSCEPLLEALDLGAAAGARPLESRLHWVIAGSESGQRARPAEMDWFRSLRDQCQGMGVPYFFKQWKERGETKTSLPVLDGRRWADVPAPCSPARAREIA